MNKGRIFILLGILIGLGVGFTGTFMGLAHFQTTAGFFCNRCHFMKGEVREWKRSTHAKVACVKCHFRPGPIGYVSGNLLAAMMTFQTLLGKRDENQPITALVHDSSCLRCHRDEMRKSLSFQGKSFTHQALIRDGYKCTQCHSTTGMGKAVPKGSAVEPWLP